MMNQAAMNNVFSNFSAPGQKVQNSVKASVLAWEIHNRMRTGEDVFDIAAEKLPATSRTVIEDRIDSISNGIDSFYDRKNLEVSPEQIRSHMNKVLQKHSNSECAVYLIRLIETSMRINDKCLNDAQKEQLDELKGCDTYQAEQVNELMDLTMDTLENQAGFMTNMTFNAVEKAMFNKELDVNAFADMAGSGRDMAVAYAVAQYITLSTSNPSAVETNLDAMNLGAGTAASVESSKVIGLCFSGKLAWDKAKAMVCKLFSTAYHFVAENLPKVLAGYIQINAGLYVFKWSVILMSYVISSVPVLVTVSAAIAAIVAGKMLNNQEIADTISGMWTLICKGCSKLFHLIGLVRDEAGIEADAVAEADNDTSDQLLDDDVFDFDYLDQDENEVVDTEEGEDEVVDTEEDEDEDELNI